MDQPNIAQLTERIRILEAQIQQMQQQYPVSRDQGQQAQGRYGDYRVATPITPAGPEIAAQKAREGEQAEMDRRAAVAETDSLPTFDPNEWAKSAEGTHDTVRRQRVVQQIKLRKAIRQGQQDMAVLNQATMDIDSQPPEAQFKAAQAFADEHRDRVAQERGEQSVVRPATPQGQEWPNADAPRPASTRPPLEPQIQPESPATKATGSGQPPRQQPPTPPPYRPQPDTSTQIPQPDEWRDDPQRQNRGPYNQTPQQQTFGQMQAGFDAAVARQMEMISGFVQDTWRRVEELECWRESMSQE